VEHEMKKGTEKDDSIIPLLQPTKAARRAQVLKWRKGKEGWKGFWV